MPEVPAGYMKLDKSERRAGAGVRLVGPADPAETLTVSVRVHRRPGAPPLPDASRGGMILNHDQFARVYGAADEDMDRVARFGAAHGLQEAERSVPRRTVVLAGTVQQMNDAFAVDLGTYTSLGETYRGREGAVHVPAELIDVVEGVFGLDNRRVAYRAAVGIGPVLPKPPPPPPPSTATPLTPPQVARLYQFPSVSAAGQTIGLLEFGYGGYSVSDIELSMAPFGLNVPNIIPVATGGMTIGAAEPAMEQTLDIVVAASVAQGANIAVYFAPWSEQGFVDAVTTAVHDNANNPSVLSISYGLAELSGLWSQAAMEAISATFQEAAGLGITVLVASGDSGSDFGAGGGIARVGYPASDPYVTACGGTWIHNVQGSSFEESTWPQTGGGVSDVFDLPTWQAFAGVPPSANGNGRIGRGVPDVAGNAAPQSGYNIVLDGKPPQPIGGTSAVAPLYAGLVAMINASLTTRNEVETRVGYLNPSLYSAGMQSAFRDVADGVSNATPQGLDGAPGPGYTSGPGWDACTGLGSINGSELLALLSYPEATSCTGQVAALARLADHLDVLWFGFEGAVLTTSWDTNENNDQWGLVSAVAPANSAAPGAISTVARLPQHLDVFWVGADGSVQTDWWDQNANNAQWNTPFNVASPGSAAPGAIIALARTPQHLDVFWIGTDGSVQTTWWDQNANNGQWNTPFNVASPGSAAPGAIIALARTPQHLDVFWVGTDGSVQTTWWDQNANNGQWNTPFNLAAAGSAAPGVISALARIPQHLDVFWVGTDWSVQTTWWDQNANNGQWNQAFPVAPAGSAATGAIVALARMPQHLDVFWIGNDESVQTTWWDQNANNGQWNTPFNLAPVGAVPGPGNITALARVPEALDVFWIDEYGAVQANSYDENHGWSAGGSPITPPSTATGSLAAVSRLPLHLDVFWIGPDGSMRSTWWDQNANNGQWNTNLWFPISPAGGFV
jgi:kumamolisin